MATDDGMVPSDEWEDWCETYGEDPGKELPKDGKSNPKERSNGARNHRQGQQSVHCEGRVRK